ncbi:hypothetical protein BgAZ_400330 [Babesia gibsoni]|uniref:Uncharacterized protein n=1 Tax=Babesia gibsoni TaxID=33632 RepID=A0AAD8LIF1_BABGI|nr:hypothetical protein BgAZ_400330 [Babesia gibsoni]
MTASMQKLVAVVSRVREAAESFKNPMFRHYFAQKATEELELLKKSGSSLPSTDIEDRLKLNEELLGILHRQSFIQNQYYTSEPEVEK